MIRERKAGDLWGFSLLRLSVVYLFTEGTATDSLEGAQFVDCELFPCTLGFIIHLLCCSYSLKFESHSLIFILMVQDHLDKTVILIFSAVRTFVLHLCKMQRMNRWRSNFFQMSYGHTLTGKGSACLTSARRGTGAVNQKQSLAHVHCGL